MASHATVIRRCLILTAASFLIMTAICMVLHPKIFEYPNYGISYFGSVPTVFIPYYTGYAIVTVCLAMIAHRLRIVEREFRLIQVIFWIAGVTMPLVALTSFSGELTIFSIHMLITFLLIACELAVAGWIVTRRGAEMLDYWLFAIFAVVLVISVIPAIYTLPFLEIYAFRELVVFVCALGLTGRMALRVVDQNTNNTKPR